MLATSALSTRMLECYDVAITAIVCICQPAKELIRPEEWPLEDTWIEARIEGRAFIGAQGCIGAGERRCRPSTSKALQDSSQLGHGRV